MEDWKKNAKDMPQLAKWLVWYSAIRDELSALLEDYNGQGNEKSQLFAWSVWTQQNNAM